MSPLSPPSPWERALRVLTANAVVDGYNDLPSALRSLVGGPVGAGQLAGFELDRHQPRTRTDLRRLAQGRVGAQFWSARVPSGPVAGPAPGDALLATLQQIDLVHLMVRQHADRMTLVRTPAELAAALHEGRIGALIGAGGRAALGESLAVLRVLFRLGVRFLTLTGFGALDGFGRDVLREMNRIGMLVDLSHVADATSREVLLTGTLPVVFSHSSARTLCDHPGNVPDDLLAELADNGGACLAAFTPELVSARRYDWVREGRPGPPPPVTLAEVADHLDHLREVAGVLHVGLGGAFDGGDDMPDGLSDVSCYPALFAELASRHWSDGELAGLAGGNVIRVLRAVESGAELGVQ